MEKLNCEQAKRLDLMEYLAFLGHQPQKIRNGDFWYLSPLRDEKTASFKVNRHRGIWFDHGIGKGGDLIDFGTLYHNCSVSELLERLSGSMPALFTRQLFPAIFRVLSPGLLVKKKRLQTAKLLCWIPARWLH